ncbi:EAL domain-containing protein [Sphingobium sufflavum]|uniref:sensor domain-containing protein n=1 Tax=Sphingobium sufflavum TaxID=1129547 RepID=UPI001F1A4163|nr:EAL domain-containing protein [Sphingobium sufflavum]MCE7795982.1 EAL domain-containing protein [Sphingobium sufflavum]
MDYFVGRRFGERNSEAGQDAARPKGFAGHNNIAFSPLFDTLTPAIVRWVTDRRGRLRQVEGGPTAFGRQCESAVAARGWAALLSARDRRQVIHIAAHADRPKPLRLSLTLGGRTRQALLRMARGQDADGAPFWYGTVEDIHDHADEEMRALRAVAMENEEHYRSFVELSPQVPWTARPDGRIEEVGPRWESLTGTTRDDALDGGWIRSLHPDDVTQALAIWAAKLESGDPVDVRYRVRGGDGHYRWMRARGEARRDRHGAIVRWYGTLEDIHEAELTQQARTDSEERLRLAVQSAGLGIWDYDLVTGIRIWSDEFRTMLGIAPDLEATSDLILQLVHADDRAILQEMMAAVTGHAMSPHFDATLRIHRADTGEMRWIRSVGWATKAALAKSSLPGSHPDSIARILVTFRDVTKERDSEERIRWTATHDPLTKLPNRALWQATLDDMATDATRTGGSFGLLLLDIDELKRANDTRGHDAGDALIRNFSRRLRAAAPDDAMVGRLGGDEFGLIAPSLADSSLLQQCSARILAALRRPYAFEGQLLECSASIGGAVFGEHGADAQTLLKAADLALYASKGTGRGRLTLFHPALRMEAEKRSAMIQLARDAIDHGRIIPYYQPRIDMRTGRVLGCEALLRWTHPERGIQLPGTIAAAFDHAEIGVTLTQTMLAAVTRDIRAWLDAGKSPGRVAMNASAADFMRGNFADYVLDALSRAGVPTCNFEIEVTETVFLGRGASHVEKALEQFASAGVRIALDDFGTGYASLSHLKQYPVDVVKIDRSFVRNLEQDRGDEAIVDAIVKLGSSLGIEVVAEGVETLGQKDILLHHGCTVGQGFLLAYPQPHSTIIF